MSNHGTNAIHAHHDWLKLGKEKISNMALLNARRKRWKLEAGS